MTSSLNSKTTQDAGVAALPRRKKETSSKPGDVSALNFWTLLHGLRKCWLPAFVVGTLLSGSVVALLWYLQPAPKQIARSLLFVSANHPFILFPRNDGYNFEMYQRSQVALVKSRFVLNAALKEETPEPVAKLSLIQEQPDPIQWLEREIQVDFAVSPETMRISMRGDNTREMPIIVNAVKKVYLDQIVGKEKKERIERLEMLEKAFSKVDEDKKKIKLDLEKLSKAAGGGNAQLLQINQLIKMEELGMAKKELADTRFQLAKLNGKIESQMARERAGEHLARALYFHFPTNFPPTGSVSLAIAGLLMHERLQEAKMPLNVTEKIEELIQLDPDFRKLSMDERELSKRLNAVRKVNPDDAPKDAILKIEAELKEIRDKMATKRKDVLPMLRDKILREAKIGAMSILEQLQFDKAILVQMQIVLEKEIEQLVQDVQNLNRANLDMDAQMEELALKDSTWKKLNNEIEIIKFEATAPARVYKLEDAIIITEPSRTTSRLAMMGFAGLACMGLVCLAFGFWETMAHRVNSPTQLIQNTGMQLMGNLPEYSKAVQTKKKNDGHYESLLSDSVDAMRTLLLFVSKMEGIRTVLVTSAVSGEGKTFSACHLAASLARAGRKTLLLDCDIRNPAVHNVFEVALHPGLCEILRGQCDLTAGIRSGSVENLMIMTAGEIDEFALRLLALEKTAEVFKVLKEEYDFIVVDSSPVLPVPDALVISPHVDAACLSILRDVSQYPKVHEAYRRLECLGVRILGAVFNGSQDDTSAMYNYTLPSKTN
jgi:polysaccharide biosynthesis transport protein